MDRIGTPHSREPSRESCESCKSCRSCLPRSRICRESCLPHPEALTDRGTPLGGHPRPRNRARGLCTVVAILLASLGARSLHAAPGAVAVDGLRCEYRVNPVGLDVKSPRLSWRLSSDGRGQRQTASRILVASSPEGLALDRGDLWDSGRIASDETLNVGYRGQPLRSRMRVWWKVRVWDREHEPSAWSAPASWTMGLVDRSDWQAKWIADPASVTNLNPTDGGVSTVKPAEASGALPGTLFRRSFALPGPVRRATAYASALGLYELRINGQRVGESLLAPEWTSYRQRVQVQTYDVTDLLVPGENVAAALVGEGWYAGRLMAMPRFPYGSYPRFLLQLEIELATGRTQTIGTDDSWRSTTDGPIRSAGIYDGETYDARQEMPGWDAPGFDASGWRRAQSFELGGPRLVWQPNEPIEVVQELAPVRMTEPKPGVFVFDLGQNMVGWCRVQARGTTGQTVTIRHAEMLNDDGTLYTANLRGAPQVDRYTPRADGEFTFEPHFTYHGFRFVELTGLAKNPTPEAVLGRVFHSTAPVVGQFDCSDRSLTRLMRNILWTQRANLMSTPNDCPQRDERFGWMGDIQAFSQTAIFNMDLAAFLTKSTQDMRDDQADDGRFPDFAPHPGNPNTAFSGAPAWADAGTIVPWRAYQNYADLRLLRDHFDAARRWVDYVCARNPDLIWATNRGNDYNDWLNGNWIKQPGWPTDGGSVPKEVFATAFFAHSTELVAKMAAVLGHAADAERYAGLASRIKTAFRNRFVTPDGRIAGDTQGGYALALGFDLLPAELRPLAADHLVDNIHRYQNHLSTGIQTTHRAMVELTRAGHSDLAWQLVTNRTFPSWLYMIDNGASTIWERWDGYVKGRGFQDAGMNSFNHWAFGAVGEWIWRNVVGLNPDDAQPGWKHFTIAPQPGGGVTWARGRYDSIRGPILSAWQLAGRELKLEISVPPNTTATVVLPAPTGAVITEDGHPLEGSRFVKLLRRTDDGAVLAVEPGRYSFGVAVAP